MAVAALRIVEPFDHGAWLVAYLVLVGFAAQLLLARGRKLVSPERDAAMARRLTVAWNLGVVAVPLGVLADSRLAVLLGGAALLLALAGYWRALYPNERGRRDVRRPVRWAYCGLLVVMTASVFIGVALGWDRPWV